MIIPLDAIKVLATLHDCNFQAYLVGGCVRDLLLGLTPKDYDVCTNATPLEMLEVFRDFSVYKTGLKHGTLTVKSGELYIEVTTYRKDGDYLDNRHPSNVVFVSELQEDLARRDFTINAMACDSTGTIYDFFAGKAALENKQIDCVGEADARLAEDSLRILRGLRFASVLDFSITEQTVTSMNKNKHLLKNISAERIHVELDKLLVGKAAGKILREHFAIFNEVIPEFNVEDPSSLSKTALWEKTIRIVENTPPIPVLRWTALLMNYCLPENIENDELRPPKRNLITAENILGRLKFDNKTKANILLLIKYQDSPLELHNRVIKRFLNKIGEEALRNLILLKKAVLEVDYENSKEAVSQLEVLVAKLDNIIETKACYSLKQLAVKGDDLLRFGIENGKVINRYLNLLLEAVMDNQCPNNKADLFKYLETIVDQFPND